MASLLSPVVRFYQFLLYPVAKPTAMILDLWLGPEGVRYVREEMLKQYILTTMGVTGSDIGTFEGKGAVNFLALDSRRVADEGSVLAPRSILSLPAVAGALDLPKPQEPVWNDFVKRGNASGQRWVVLADTAGTRFLLLHANAFLRTAFATSKSDIDPRDYCVDPIVTGNPEDTLERVLTRGNLSENHSPDRGVILVWGKQKRIISHLDVLKRLFEGVVNPVPLHRGTPGR
jgi:hypothetical protein